MISVSLWIMVYRGKGTAIASHVITTDSPNTTFSGVEVKLITVGGTASVKKRLTSSLYLHWYTSLYSQTKVQNRPMCIQTSSVDLGISKLFSCIINFLKTVLVK